MLIIATIAPKTDDGQIKKIILAGADALRFNFFYDTIEKNLELIQRSENIIDELNSKTKIFIELPLNKISLGDFDLKIFAVKENDELIFQSAPFSPDCHEFIPVDLPYLGEQVKINQTISLANGKISMQVLEVINRDTIKIKILNNGAIKAMQTFNNGTFLPDTIMIEEYKKIIKNTENFPIRFLAIPYISEDFINTIKKNGLLDSVNSKIKRVLNIEREISDAEIEALCKDQSFNIINIDRGELGVNMPFEKYGIYQKKIIQIAKKHNKKLFFCSHILPSIIDNFIPTRSDIADLTYIACENIAAGIIFSKETGASNRPAYAIHTARKIINEVEKTKKINGSC